MNKEDKDLIQKAKETPKKYEALYRKYADKVYNYFWYRTGHDKNLAEDLTQETFLRGFEHLVRFRERGYSYLTYLLQVAHNILIDYWRKPKDVPLENLKIDIPYEITKDLERKSDARALWKAIQELPPMALDVLLLRYQDELSIKEIARTVGSTENAVKLSLSRSRKKLKAHPFIKDMAQFAETTRKQKNPDFLKKQIDTF